MKPEITPFKSFLSIEEFNHCVFPWRVVASIVCHGSEQVVTLDLYHELIFVFDSQSVTYLLKYIVEQQGVIWAKERELYNKI